MPAARRAGSGSGFMFNLDEPQAAPPAQVVIARIPELTMYWDDNQTPPASLADSKIDPIAWWGERERKFPILSLLSRRYLSICATATQCESIWSHAGIVVSARRYSMKAGARFFV